MHDILLQLSSVSKTFINNNSYPQRILENINLTLKSGDLLAVLGKSGSGKSTLLRMIARLNEPTSGEIKLHLKKSSNKQLDISMIFQTFALFPWLTVLENVMLGLEMFDMPHQERRNLALKAIDQIGLDGFESAYPKELSGGMKQRVGFARAGSATANLNDG